MRVNLLDWATFIVALPALAFASGVVVGIVAGPKPAPTPAPVKAVAETCLAWWFQADPGNLAAERRRICGRK